MWVHIAVWVKGSLKCNSGGHVGGGQLRSRRNWEWKVWWSAGKVGLDPTGGKLILDGGGEGKGVGTKSEI